MKKEKVIGNKIGIIVVATVLTAVPGFATFSNAALVDNGGGMIYDTNLNITWYNYNPYDDIDYGGSFRQPNLMWYMAKDWANSLSLGNVSGWRLPETSPLNGVEWNNLGSWNGSTDGWAYNISAPGSAYAGTNASELAHLFYVTLGNQGRYDIYGNENPNWLNPINKGLLTNIQAYNNFYASNSPRDYMGDVFTFDLQGGLQSTVYTTTGRGAAIAVHDGNIGPNGVIGAAPLPSAVWLLGSGLAGLIGLRRKQ